MTICEYIKSKKEFDLMPFMSIYLSMVELVKDGYIQCDKSGNMIKKDV